MPGTAGTGACSRPRRGCRACRRPPGPSRRASGRGCSPPKRTLRRVREADRDRLREILADPEVRRWWGTGTLEEDVDDLYDDDAVGFAIELDGEVVGWIQYAEESEADYRHAGIDLALGAGARGRGLGPDAIRTLARYLFEERGHHRLTIDP